MLLLLAGTTAARAAGQHQATAPTTHVRLQVLDAEGRPLEGAGVLWGRFDELLTAAALATPVARTDAAGRVELQLPPSAPTLAAVLVAARGHAAWTAVIRSASRGRSWPAPGVALDLGIRRLIPAVTLTGKVVGPDGVAIPGARVTAADLLGSRYTGGFESGARTAADGGFRLECCVPGGVRLTVQAPGHYTTVLPWVACDAPVTVTLEESGYLSGRVLAPPSVSRNCTATMEYEYGEPSYAPQALGRAGAFDATIERPGRFRLMVTWQETSVGLSPILSAPASRVFVSTPANEGKALLVRARDRVSGQTVTVFEAHALWGESARLLAPMSRHGIGSEADGSVGLPPPPEQRRATIVVHAAGYAPGILRDYDWQDDRPNEVVVELDRESVLAGVVLEAGSGKPLAGVPVGLRLMSGAFTQCVLSTADGRFRFGELGAERYRIEARSKDYSGQALLANLRLGVAEAREDLELVLPAGFRIHGTVEGVGKAADLGLRVGTDSPASNLPFPTSSVRALGAGGSFEALYRGPLPVELLLVEPVDPRQGEARLWPLGSLAQRPEQPLQLRFAAKGRSRVHGRLKSSGLAIPAGRLLVRLRPAEYLSPTSSPGQRLQWRDGGRWCWVGADGSYALDALPGEVQLTCEDPVSHLPLVMTTTTITADESVALDLDARLAAIDVALPARRGFELEVQPARGPDAPRTLVRARSTVALHGNVTAVRLFVPAGPVTLEVTSGWEFQDFLRHRTGRGKVLASAKVECEAGKTHAVALRAD